MVASALWKVQLVEIIPKLKVVAPQAKGRVYIISLFFFFFAAARDRNFFFFIVRRRFRHGRIYLFIVMQACVNE